MSFGENVGALLARAYGMLRRASGPGWAMLSQLITSGGNFITSAIIVRELGLVEFGRFSVAFMIIMIVRNLLNGAILVPMSVIGSKLRGSSAAVYRGFLALNGGVFAVGTSLLFLALGWALSALPGMMWFGDLALGAALANFTSNLADYFRRYEFTQFRAARACWIDAVRFFVQLAVIAALAVVWRGSFTAGTALLAVAAGGAAGTMLGLVIHGAVRWQGNFARAAWSRHARFIRWMLPSVALETLQANAPLFIGGAFLGEATLGSVRAVQQLANILSLPTNALQQVAPSMAGQRFKAAGAKAMGVLLFKLTLGGALILIGSSALVMVGWPVISEILFRSHDMHLFNIMLLYSLVNISSLGKQMLFIYFQSSERPRTVSGSALVGAVCAVLAVIALLPVLGDMAIPVASLLSSAAAIGFLIVIMNKSVARHRIGLLVPGSSAP